MTIPIPVPLNIPVLLNLSRLNKTDNIKKKVLKPSKIKKLYTQVINSLLNVEDILYIKDVFPNLFANKVADILNITNKNVNTKKFKINIMTKRPLRKQIIISMIKSNVETIINSAYQYITNINRCLKEIKLNTSGNYIYCVNNGIVITINQFTIILILKTIEKYLKNISNINSDSIMSP